MRVLLDARKLGHGGIGSYLSGLISGLLEVGKTELTLLVDSREKTPQLLVDSCNIVETNLKPYSVGEFFKLARVVDSNSYDIVHIPHYTLPFGFKKPSVVTVHDLIHINHPPRPFYPMVAGPLIRSALSRAKRVIAVSEATRSEIVQFYPNVKNRLSVVPNPLNAQLASLGRTYRAANKNGEDFFLSICSLGKPHKGARELIEAFQIFRRITRSPMTLLIAGQGAAEAREALLRQGIQLPGNEVVFRGDLTLRELAELYGRTRALVVPSRTEGFCLPALEAQSIGVPVIATPVLAVQELMTPFDIVADDFSPRALAEAMASFVRSGAPGKEEPQSTYERHFVRFHAKKIAESTLQVYEDALQ